MTIPETATKAGSMDSNITTGIPTATRARFDHILSQWQAAVNYKHYHLSQFTHPADQVHGTFGKAYARLNIGSSGAFMVDLIDGYIYGIKGFGKVDKKKEIGNITHPSFDAAVLVRDRFRHGRFRNNPDGSLTVVGL